MVDIRELARRSGVSVATVSRALNGRTDVSRATRERILALARSLGYSPNQSARTLVRRRSDTIGLVWDTSYETTGRRQPFLSDILVGLKRALDDNGYHLMLLATSGARTAVDSYVREARQHSLDGIVLMGVDEHHPAVTALVSSDVPCVAVDMPLRGPRASYVTSDNRTGAATAVRHLHELGHRDIATITGPLNLMPAVERLAGYRYEMARLGLRHQDSYVAHGDFFLASGREGMARLLALPGRPTAVFVAGDEMAIGALHAAVDAGLRVPTDIAIVAFDDIEAASLVRPALTTIAQDRGAFGAAAVSALLATIDRAAETGPGEATAVPAASILPTRLVVRESCGATDG